MKSEADIIYNHIVGSCNDNIEKIELGGDANLPHILNQYKYKTTNRIFNRVIEKEEAMKKADLNSVILMPYFLKECSKREKDSEGSISHRTMPTLSKVGTFLSFLQYLEAPFYKEPVPYRLAA